MVEALVIVDIQRDYFEGGAYPLPLAEAAATKAAVVLRRQRALGRPVVHVRHESQDDTPFLRPGTPGAQIHPRLPLKQVRP